MTDQIGADFRSLDRTQVHIGTTASQVNGALADLKNYLKPLVATWEGEAATSYQALQKKWDAAATDLNAVLQRIGHALADTNSDFQSTEKANAARF